MLTPQEVEEFFAILRRMREQGKTVIIITHKLSEVLAISDDVTVMRDGRVVGRVKTAETSAAELARMMVGRDVLLRVEKPDARPGETVLSVDRLSITVSGGERGLRDVSFEVRAGEIVGIAGVEGNGQTELIEALAGLVPAAQVSGEMRVRRARHHPRRARANDASWASRTSPKTGTGAGCCSTSICRRTPSSASTTAGRPSPAGPFLDIVRHPRRARRS